MYFFVVLISACQTQGSNIYILKGHHVVNKVQCTPGINWL